MSARLITKETFAALAGVSVHMVSMWIQRGVIPSVKLGQYRLINIAGLNL